MVEVVDSNSEGPRGGADKSSRVGVPLMLLEVNTRGRRSIEFDDSLTSNR